MGVHKVAVFFIHASNGILCGSFIGIASIEIAETVTNFLAHLIFLFFFQSLHQCGNFFSVTTGEMVEQPLQIAGDENIHGRGTGYIKFPIAVVDSCSDEISQNLVFIGSANEFLHGDAHLRRIICRQYISEIPRRNNDIDLFTAFDCALFDQFHICPHVISHLGNQSADVYGIGRRELVAFCLQLFCQLSVVEDIFNCGLGVVKVAFDGKDMCVGSLLGDHLPCLHLADAVFREEHDDFRIGHVRKSFQRGLSRIP